MKQNGIILFISLLLWSIQINGQNEISGRILQQDNKPLEFVNIVLSTQDSVFATGTTSDQSGKFKLKNIPSGDYYITTAFLGYTPGKIALAGLSGSIDLGDIIVKEESTLLDAVTVTASNITNKTDRMIVFVTDQQKEHSNNGINLLATMQLPRLIVNPLMNTISLPGDEEIQLCINGAMVDETDIKALQPNEIIRIEYINNPGVRYGNAEVVINYILKRATTGGSGSVNLMNAVTNIFGNEQVAFKMNHKKSEFGFIYSGRFREMDEVWNDKVSDFNFTDKKMTRFDEGIPGEWKENAHQFTLNYNLLDEKNYFNSTFRYGITDQNKMTYTNQHTSLDLSRVTSVHQGAKTFQHLPSVDLYYSHSFNDKQTLILNAVGTYIHSDVNQIYEETKEEELITDIVSDVDGEKYSIIGEGIYEKIFENSNRFTAGLKHSQAFANNEYKGTVNSLAKMNQSESYIFVEYTGKVNKFSYMGGVGLSRSWTKQEGEKSHTDYLFRPKMTLQYNFKPELFLRLKGEIYNTTPSLANLSAVEQYMDTLRITRGNPNLKATMNYQSGWTFGWEKEFFGIHYDASYLYNPGAIMEEIFRENDLFISTYDNQKNWRKLNNELTLKMKPIRNMLTFSLTGGVNRYWSQGNTYTHNHTNFYYRATLMFMYKKFIAYFSSSNAYNNLWGETLLGGENTQQFLVTYNHEKFSVGTGIMSPFSNTYKRRTENRNVYSPYESYGYINNLSRMVMVNFSWNFDFGRKAKSEDKRINNTDSDTGIMRMN
jgi:hypothetical protein